MSMIIFYLGLSLLLLIAFSFIIVPFRGEIRVYKNPWLKICGFFIIISFAFYIFLSDIIGAIHWQREGKVHYELLNKLQQLGNISQVIARMQGVADRNPTDAQAWYLLSRLYYLNHEDSKARMAIERAYQLRSDDKEIKQMYLQLQSK